MNRNYYAVIMAGGIGSRFWPMSRNTCPKQFLDILGTGKSFLQQTFERFTQIIPRENIVIVTGSSYVELVHKQLPDLDACQVLAEPLRRNTAPCIAYATYKIADKNPNATIVVAPSDHFISHEAKFIQLINNMLNFASSADVLVTIGIKPTRPETGYGYIQMNMSTKQQLCNEKYFKVKTFTEKPSLELARTFIESGEFFWNSGIFVWSTTSIRQSLQSLLPEVNSLFAQGVGKYNTPEEIPFIREIYNKCMSISVDHGIMEGAKNVYAFLGDFGWSDLGTWESLYIHCDKDKHQNMIDAQVLLNHVSNSVITISDKNKLTIIEGLDNYLIIDTPDVLLIYPRNQETQFKQIIDKVNPEYL